MHYIDPGQSEGMQQSCTLKDFAGFLKCACNFTIVPGRTTFGERIRLQKYIFIATKMGLCTAVPLDYSMYIRGPYSSTLADIYFNEHAWDTPLFSVNEFDARRYASLLGGRDTTWLELCATILYVMPFVPVRKGIADTATLVRRIQELKPFSAEEIRTVYEMIREKGFLLPGERVIQGTCVTGD